MAAPLGYSQLETGDSPDVSESSLHPLARLRGQSRAGAILSDDALTTYMNQIRRIELLPQETQDRLARAFVEDNDQEAGKTLVWSNLRLVVSIAHDFHRPGQDLLDLIQEGNLGLSEALVRFDPDRGTPFVGYAQFWIRAMILNHLLNLSRPVRLGNSRDGRKLFFNLKKARRAVARNGLEPTADNVAQYLDVDPDEVVRVATLLDGGGLVYLDAPRFDDDDSPSALDSMVAPGDDPQQAVDRSLFRRRFQGLVDQFLETLPDERRVIIWKERIVAVEPRYLKDLGAQFGVSKERVRQLEADVEKRFRQFIEEEMGDELHHYLAH